MSDEVSGVNIDPEEGGTIVGPETPPPVEGDGEPDGTIEGSGGVKFVPLSAVIAERTQRKEATRALAGKDAEIADLRAKAGQLDAIKNEWDQLQPVLEKVRRGEYQEVKHEEPGPPQPLTQADALDYAKDLDLYKADGTPDVDRAQRLAARQEAISARQTAKAVAPYQATQAQRESVEMRNQVAAMKDSYGYQVDPVILERVWSMVPPEISAQPNVASVLHRVAFSEAVMAGKHPAFKAGQQPPPVVPTESLGGGRAPEMTSFNELDKRFSSAAGITKERYVTAAAAFKPGQRNSLGED